MYFWSLSICVIIVAVMLDIGLGALTVVCFSKNSLLSVTAYANLRPGTAKNLLVLLKTASCKRNCSKVLVFVDEFYIHFVN